MVGPITVYTEEQGGTDAVVPCYIAALLKALAQRKVDSFV